MNLFVAALVAFNNRCVTDYLAKLALDRWGTVRTPGKIMGSLVEMSCECIYKSDIV